MYHEVTILGRLGRDAEMRYLADGTPVINFSMASNRSWNDGKEWQSEATWFRVSCFGKSFESRYPRLVKAAQVMVVGRLVPDKETGTPKIYKDKASYDIRCQILRIVVVPEADAATEEETAASPIPF